MFFDFWVTYLSQSSIWKKPRTVGVKCFITHVFSGFWKMQKCIIIDAEPKTKNPMAVPVSSYLYQASWYSLSNIDITNGLVLHRQLLK